MYAVATAIAPWAKLTIRAARQISTRASANAAYTAPRRQPVEGQEDEPVQLLLRGEWSEPQVGVAEVVVVAQRRPPWRRPRPGRATSPRPGRRRTARCARSARPAARSARCVSRSCAQQGHDLRGDPRRQAERRLVEQQQPGPRRPAPGRARASAARRRRAGGRGALPARPAAGTARRPRRALGGVRRGRVRHRPPSRRFSSTVSSVTTPRPSGTCAMPRRTSCSTGTRRRSRRRSRPGRRSAGSSRTACAAASSCRRRWRRAPR